MTEPAPGGIRFAHVCLMVKDIHAAIADYRQLLQVLDPTMLEQKIVFYEDFGLGDERLSFCTFPSPSDGVEIQMMQPLTPGTPLYERLLRHGEHVHHLCFTSDRVRDMVGQLEHLGIGIVPQGYSQDPQMPWQEWTFVHPARSHGVLIELANHYRSVDGTWQPASPVRASGS